MISADFNFSQWIFYPVAALLVSAFITWVMIHYAYWRGLLDQPGQRRSHSLPTPRAGGVGIVIATLIWIGIPFYRLESGDSRVAIAGLLGLLAIALIGWWDDHHPLSARLRFAVHLLVALALGLSFGARVNMLLLIFIVLSCAWSINLHNFMDGIHGILAAQSIFVFSVLGTLAVIKGASTFALGMFMLSAAIVGFLPFNFPRARIFMGDVGSGSLGYLIALAVWIGYFQGIVDVLEALIICSVFVVDATCTLLLRISKGRRWYSAHREHLYQWLVRSGDTHAYTVGRYLLWDVLVVIPAIVGYEANKSYAIFIVAMVYGLAIGWWLVGKYFCMHRIKMIKQRHATA